MLSATSRAAINTFRPWQRQRSAVENIDEIDRPTAVLYREKANAQLRGGVFHTSRKISARSDGTGPRRKVHILTACPTRPRTSAVASSWTKDQRLPHKP